MGDRSEPTCNDCGGPAPDGCTIPDLALGPQVYCKDCCPRCNLSTGGDDG